ncbi:MAG TPA: dihydrodipicolinate synthase family protein [Erwinia persicina]|uniref:dihydrodipicolinate synthase family protein n=1 Tax=Erwinia persicina TaxID=55211 RepID=UPI000E7D948E|nr:dihydrodipicolinate synthase family protein [Erwinia persicina]MCQ4094703.1 dihydrodipicolinate synthase family protein [Erwinia persicina]MCQ4102582.1 dihydrodipicolinate synthase family protein [Erwinia persicina]MCQ4105466.1 dihydrodipicolinate synthase family protein [Erwinia persicina]UTX12099.1 dihydrodipicolinate synthase family protein [Erwinia persicina]HBQ81102.1 dihydrodipicolinate synthase family protein [Erwinia persicina]
MQFKGLSAFPITPTDAAGVVDIPALEKVLLRLKQAGVDSVGLPGSTGLYAYLSRDQKRRAIEAAVACLGPDIPVIASAGALRTDEACLLAQDAESAGAKGILLAPVSYTPLGEEEVFQHYASVAGATGLPVCVYNNPGTTHFTFTHRLLQRLGTLKQIRAVKQPGQSGIGEQDVTALRDLFPAEFAVGYSGDWFAAGALLGGGDVWFSVVGGLLPQPALALTRAAQAGEAERVAELNQQFEPLWQLFQSLSSLRVMYAAADILGICQPVLPRPLLGLDSAERRRVEQVLKDMPNVV